MKNIKRLMVIIVLCGSPNVHSFDLQKEIESYKTDNSSIFLTSFNNDWYAKVEIELVSGVIFEITSKQGTIEAAMIDLRHKSNKLKVEYRK